MSAFSVSVSGHEGCGVVVKVGVGVSNLKIGDRAGVKPIWATCETCGFCLGDLEIQCLRKLNTGLAVPGTFQEYVLADSRHAIHIPDGVPDYLAATLMCSGAAAYRSVKSANLAPATDVVGLGGAGSVGIQVVQLRGPWAFGPFWSMLETINESCR
ncbi:hypothetical protein ColTof4_07147 [Colletotrichum tofieldiae]|nr:hypothetical protein ColTof3_12089 [Colletotrichum tofieldiae]GKT74724.1 hypothetical protein ColTof4_07147 [Colletotrichum tofieldiae]GKT91913.1 hypothetical protein Ct61P_09763 [Colletotrichum tofieldiae]